VACWPRTVEALEGESSSGQNHYRFVLANPSHVVDSDREAGARATADFSEACRVDDASGSIEAMGRQLSARGYVVLRTSRLSAKMPNFGIQRPARRAAADAAR
jgi:hypothetical protein